MNRTAVGLTRASTSFRRRGKEDVDGRVKPGHDEEIDPYPFTTGPPAFFQASMPPSIWAVLARPASLAAFTAIAERSPKAQKNTTRRPVAAATSRSMPPGCRFSQIEV